MLQLYTFQLYAKVSYESGPFCQLFNVKNMQRSVLRIVTVFIAVSIFCSFIHIYIYIYIYIYVSRSLLSKSTLRLRFD